MSAKQKIKSIWKTLKKLLFIFPDLLFEKNISRFINVTIFFSTTILLVQIVQLQKILNEIEKLKNKENKTEFDIFYIDALEDVFGKITLLLIWNFIFLFLQFIEANYSNYFIFKKIIWVKIVGLISTLVYFSVNVYFVYTYDYMRAFETYTLCICYFLNILYYIFLFFNHYKNNKYPFFSCFKDDLEIYYHEYTYQLINNRPSVFWKKYIKDHKSKINIRLYITQEKTLHNKSDPDYFPKKEKLGMIKSFIKSITEIFIPFFTFKTRLQIGEIIHYPTKLIIAVFSSAYLYYFVMGTLSELIIELNKTIEDQNLIMFFSEFTNVKVVLLAVRRASVTTLVVESIYLFFISVYMFVHFKKSIWKLRRGKKRFKGIVRSYNSINFLPNYLSNIVICNYIMTFLLFFILTVLYLPFFWTFLWSKKYEIYILVLTRIVSIVILYIMRSLTFSENCVIRRKLLFFFDLINFFLGLIVGLVRQATRAVFGMVGTLFLIFRVDRPVINFFNLDSAYHSYSGLLYFYHLHNNPICNTFMNMFLEDFKMRNETKNKKLKTVEIKINDDEAHLKKSKIKNSKIKNESNINNESIIETEKFEDNIQINIINHDESNINNEEINLKSNQTKINDKNIQKENNNNIKKNISLENSLKDNDDKEEDIYNQEQWEESERIRRKKKRIVDRFYFCVFLARNSSLVKWRIHKKLIVKKKRFKFF